LDELRRRRLRATERAEYQEGRNGLCNMRGPVWPRSGCDSATHARCARRKHPAHGNAPCQNTLMRAATYINKAALEKWAM